MALAFSPALSHCAPDRNASMAVRGGAAAMAVVALVPSNALSGTAIRQVPRRLAPRRPAPIIVTRNGSLAIRITRLLARPARMGDRAVDGRPHLLGVFP